MKMLKKLALVSAISMISAGAFAMEAMDDESMSAATGQDGITIKIIPGEFTNAAAIAAATTAGYKAGPDVKALGVASGYKGLTIGEVRIHDDDGLGAFVASGNGTANSGAIVIGGGTSADITLAAGGDAAAAARNAADSTYLFTNQASAITVLIDSVGDFDGQTSTAVGAMLNISISTPSLRIQTGAIYVANSNAGETTHDADGVLRGTALGGDVDGTAVSAKIKILDGMGLTMGASTTNIQLGTEAQGAMIVANTTMVGGLTIDTLSLNDAGQAVALTQLGDAVTSGGSLYVGQLKVTGNGSADLALNVNVDVGSRNTAFSTFSAAQLTTFNNTAAANYGYGNYATLTTAATGGTAAVYATFLANGTGSPTAADIAAYVKAGVDTNRATLVSNEPTLAAGYNGLVISLVSVGGTKEET